MCGGVRRPLTSFGRQHATLGAAEQLQDYRTDCDASPSLRVPSSQSMVQKSTQTHDWRADHTDLYFMVTENTAAAPPCSWHTETQAASLPLLCPSLLPSNTKHSTTQASGVLYPGMHTRRHEAYLSLEQVIFAIHGYQRGCCRIFREDAEISRQARWCLFR